MSGAHSCAHFGLLYKTGLATHNERDFACIGMLRSFRNCALSLAHYIEVFVLEAICIVHGDFRILLTGLSCQQRIQLHVDGYAACVISMVGSTAHCTNLATNLSAYHPQENRPTCVAFAPVPRVCSSRFPASTV